MYQVLTGAAVVKLGSVTLEEETVIGMMIVQETLNVDLTIVEKTFQVLEVIGQILLTVVSVSRGRWGMLEHFSSNSLSTF